jgi:transcriptional regulator with XRE-family HTH domain
MELPKYIHGPQENLPNTLASRISLIRNARGLHIFELSKLARVSIKLLEDIEAGIETWLPVAVRQRIARVLNIDPCILEEVEVKNKSSIDINKEPPLELLERIEEEVLSGAKEINCPVCGNKLRIWIQEGFDLNDEPVKSAKGHCTVCVFQLKK